jgi:hypothetical protein
VAKDDGRQIAEGGYLAASRTICQRVEDNAFHLDMLRDYAGFVFLAVNHPAGNPELIAVGEQL